MSTWDNMAYCSPYCDSSNRLVSGSYCNSHSNITVYCCGTPQHKYCCYDSELDVGGIPGDYGCESGFTVKFTNLLPWVPIMLILLIAYPLCKKCKQRWLHRPETQSPQSHGNASVDGDEENAVPPSPDFIQAGMPPSYEEVTAKPPAYDEICGLVNMGFSIEDIENAGSVPGIHGQSPHPPPTTSPQQNSITPPPHTAVLNLDNQDSSSSQSTSLPHVSLHSPSSESTAETSIADEPPPVYSELPNLPV